MFGLSPVMPEGRFSVFCYLYFTINAFALQDWRGRSPYFPRTSPAVLGKSVSGFFRFLNGAAGGLPRNIRFFKPPLLPPGHFTWPGHRPQPSDFPPNHVPKRPRAFLRSPFLHRGHRDASYAPLRMHKHAVSHKNLIRQMRRQLPCV